MKDNIKITQGIAASELMANSQFVEQWRILYEKCSWATVFQSTDFVLTWFDVYSEYKPLLIFQYGKNNCLKGLLILAIGENGNLSFAGTHHAEYKTWLEEPDSGGFIRGAFEKLIELFPDFVINISYIKDSSVIDVLNKYLGAYVIVSRVPAYKKIMDEENVFASLRKKGNRSKIKRLEKLGKVEFRRVESADEFENFLGICGVFHDIRQGATNNSFPFSNDKRKLAFHVDLLKKNPSQLHVTVLLIDDYPVGMHIGYQKGDEVLYSINAYNPMMPRFSIGKIIFLLLSNQFLEEGIRNFDLSPGGDEWKHSFSSEAGEAYSVVLYSTKTKRLVFYLKRKLAKSAKRMLKAIGVTRGLLDNIASLKISEKKLDSSPLLQGAVYTLDRHELKPVKGKGNQKNNLAKLIEYDFFPTGPTRQEFMCQVIERISRGERIYSCESGGVMQCYTWESSDYVKLVALNVGELHSSSENNDIFYTINCRDKILNYDTFKDMVQAIINDVFGDAGLHCVYIYINFDDVKVGQLLCNAFGFKKVSSLSQGLLEVDV